MDTPQNRADATAGSVEDWATESLFAARTAYRDRTTLMRIGPGPKLEGVDLDANLPVVRGRIYKGGIRLTMVLNEVWPED
jgi:hypothetical protein